VQKLDSKAFKALNDGGARTPVAVLAYEPDGGCLCLYHPGMPDGLTLSTEQRALIGRADWVCVTVGPPQATAAVLESLRTEAKLAWVVKHDPRALSTALAQQLARRADLICCSQAERAFVNETLPADPRRGQILIETQGGKGAAMMRDGTTTTVRAKPIIVSDPTGAGDTFAGGVLAALASGNDNPSAILEAGHRAAAALLRGRRTIERESALHE
jgi:ribokinase